jgi:hypothetical protein
MEIVGGAMIASPRAVQNKQEYEYMKMTKLSEKTKTSEEEGYPDGRGLPVGLNQTNELEPMHAHSKRGSQSHAASGSLRGLDVAPSRFAWAGAVVSFYTRRKACCPQPCSMIRRGRDPVIYFVHEWQPRFNGSALLGDPEMLTAVTALNRQIARLAPVLTSPTVPDADASMRVPNHPQKSGCANTRPLTSTYERSRNWRGMNNTTMGKSGAPRFPSERNADILSDWIMLATMNEK